VAIGACVDAGGVAAEIVDGGVADGLEVLVHDLLAAVFVAVKGGHEVVAGFIGELFSVLKEFGDVTFNVAGSALEVSPGLVGELFVELELATAFAEASLVEAILPVAVLIVELV